MSSFTHRAGFYPKTETRKLISFIESYAPVLIHIHNIHGFYMNVEILFNYKKIYHRSIEVDTEDHDKQENRLLAESMFVELIQKIKMQIEK